MSRFSKYSNRDVPPVSGLQGASTSAPTTGAANSSGHTGLTARGPGSALPRSGGIRRLVKERLVRDMIEKVDSAFKILIVDDSAARMINAVMRMHDLMDLGVTLVEQLSIRRQPVKQSDAIYFVAPTIANVDRMNADWAASDMYRAAHLFFTTSASPAILEKLATTRIASKLKSFIDLQLDFTAPDPLFFTCDLRLDIPNFFGTAANPHSTVDAARQLVSVLRTAGEAPVVRYQNTSAARSMAQHTQDMLDALGADAGAKSGTLVILDRSIDVAAALIHEVTYEAMVSDLAPLKNGTATIMIKNHPSEVPIDVEDELWVSLRNQHIGTVSQACQEQLTALQQQYPELAKWDPKNTDISMKRMGDAIRDLPKFQQQQMRIMVHMELASKVMGRYGNEGIDPLVKLEQKLVTGIDAKQSKPSAKELLKEATGLLQMPMSREAKMRLIVTFAATQGSEKVGELLRVAGLLDADRAAVDAIRHFDPLAKAKVARKAYDKSLDYFETWRYVPAVKSVMIDAATGALDNETYAYVRPPPSGHQAATAAAAAHQGAGSGFGTSATPAQPEEKKSRFGGLFSRSKNSASSPPPSGSGARSVSPQANRQQTAAAVLELGHGDTVELESSSRIWIFVLGGVTVSEIRSAYEVTRAHRREIIVGGTSLIRGDSFVNDLALIAA